MLNIDRTATDDDLRRAYRRLAMRWHPDKNPAGKADAEARFKEITEAYNVRVKFHSIRAFAFTHRKQELLNLVSLILMTRGN
jgi:preprotein translocase subunit Sec63